MKRLVVVGNGMAGMACLEQILKYAPQFEVTVWDETHVNYNRIMLSSVLAGESADDIVLNSVEWVRAAQHQSTRRRPHRRRRYARENGDWGDGSVTRTTRCSWPRAVPRGCRRSTASRKTASSFPHARRHACATRTSRARREGGGYRWRPLGLEAARGLQVQGCDVTVVHLMSTC